MPLATIWDDLASAQDDVFRLLEGGRLRPSQLRDLNFQATVLSFLMAKGSNDMGDPKTAMVQARVALSCADDAEHPGLIALVNGLKSLIAYWANQPEDALHFARQGAAHANPQRGTVGLWMLGLEARAAALLGDEATVRTANRAATERRDRVTPDDLDALGGLLTYPDAKQHYYTVEAEVLLGHGGEPLATQAAKAVQGFSDPNAPEWAFGDLAGAQCNQALTYLYGGDLDGAASAIRPVLDLPASLRNQGIVVSAARVRQALTAAPPATPSSPATWPRKSPRTNRSGWPSLGRTGGDRVPACIRSAVTAPASPYANSPSMTWRLSSRSTGAAKPRNTFRSSPGPARKRRRSWPGPSPPQPQLPAASSPLL